MDTLSTLPKFWAIRATKFRCLASRVTLDSSKGGGNAERDHPSHTKKPIDQLSTGFGKLLPDGDQGRPSSSVAGAIQLCSRCLPVSHCVSTKRLATGRGNEQNRQKRHEASNPCPLNSQASSLANLQACGVNWAASGPDLPISRCISRRAMKTM